MTDLRSILEFQTVEASAPCRIDCGGTLDIKTFFYPLRYLAPCTFNIAINLRTRVVLRPYESGWIKVTSKGFESAAFPAGEAPFDSPLGLIFAIADCYRLDGVEVVIHSVSPPRSALGGSSTAAVALIGALSMALHGQVSQKKTVLLAHTIEEAVAGIPCGMQDQLAAAFGGVHAWDWPSEPTDHPFKQKQVLKEADHAELERHLLLAYCGAPHTSSDINGKWVRDFLSGKNRSFWKDIVLATKAFVKALSVKDWASAVQAMNQEVEIRCAMTPEVFDDMGNALRDKALAAGCGARFTGAGGGGCIWAIGTANDIENLRTQWQDVLSSRTEAKLLDVHIDSKGLEVTCY
jgi:D-glycero-alpha-D-manno-heptose-7-phosphate kinase